MQKQNIFFSLILVVLLTISATPQPILAQEPEESAQIEPVLVTTYGDETGANDADAIAATNTEETDEITAENLGIKDPKILPDSPFYGFKNFWNNLTVALTFNPEKKAQKQLQIANEKLLEIKKLSQKGVAEKIINSAIIKYDKATEKVNERIGALKEKNQEKTEQFLEKAAQHEIKRQEILEKIKDNAPKAVITKLEETRQRVRQNFTDLAAKFSDNEELREKIISTAKEMDDLHQEIIIRREELRQNAEIRKEELRQQKDELKQEIFDQKEQTRDASKADRDALKENIQEQRQEVINEIKDLKKTNLTPPALKFDETTIFDAPDIKGIK